MGKFARGNEAIVPNEGSPGGADPLLAIGSQSDIGAASVASVERPFSLAMADEEDTRCRHRGW